MSHLVGQSRLQTPGGVAPYTGPRQAVGAHSRIATLRLCVCYNVESNFDRGKQSGCGQITRRLTARQAGEAFLGELRCRHAVASAWL